MEHKDEEVLRCRLIRQILMLPWEELSAVADLIDHRATAAVQVIAESEQLVPLDQAASLLGRSVLQFDGLAHLVKPGDGGKPEWRIDRRFDSRLVYPVSQN